MSSLTCCKYNIVVSEMSHGYMTVWRTYNHREFFSYISAQKLIAELLKWLISCWKRDQLPVQVICLKVQYFSQKCFAVTSSPYFIPKMSHGYMYV